MLTSNRLDQQPPTEGGLVIVIEAHDFTNAVPHRVRPHGDEVPLANMQHHQSAGGVVLVQSVAI